MFKKIYGIITQPNFFIGIVGIGFQFVFIKPYCQKLNTQINEIQKNIQFICNEINYKKTTQSKMIKNVIEKKDNLT